MINYELLWWWSHYGANSVGVCTEKQTGKKNKLLVCPFWKYSFGILLLKLWTIHFKSHANIYRQPKSRSIYQINILSRIKQLQQDWKRQEAPGVNSCLGEARWAPSCWLDETKQSHLAEVTLTLFLSFNKQDGKNMHFHNSRGVIVGEQEMRQIWSC